MNVGGNCKSRTLLFMDQILHVSNCLCLFFIFSHDELCPHTIRINKNIKISDTPEQKCLSCFSLAVKIKVAFKIIRTMYNKLYIGT